MMKEAFEGALGHMLLQHEVGRVIEKVITPLPVHSSVLLSKKYVLDRCNEAPVTKLVIRRDLASHAHIDVFLPKGNACAGMLWSIQRNNLHV